ncbi:DUF2911 domain-containing protein [Microscilla marina]|uniref:DUF2911 domain-containing protein n=1 Tax=Microscilla marina ATCC 23134 TaxID=313606 RepID=A1ZL40_MICM2|nr:DUF2911 domain-containing protein [Microscilla marina]EAY29006.1 hypothetical protein M23134_00160 [Microscilla marina ATCC 23134]
MKNLQRFAILLVVIITNLSIVYAQGMKRVSPAATTKGTINGTKVEIKYSQPAVKGRKIWGGLVAYNKVWRTGANEATTFEISKDVKIQGKTLAKGKYALFTIPGSKEWTIIFNKKAKQWGAYDYNKAKDALRVKATSQKSSTNQERLTFKIEGNQVKMRWEKLVLTFKVK